MSKIIKPLYASTSTAIAFTSLSGLAASTTAGVGAESAAVDNTTSLYTRIRLHGQFCIGSGTIANDKAIYVFLYPIVPNAGGTDTAIGYNRIPQMTDQTLPRTSPNPTAKFPETMPGVRLVAVVPVTAAGTLLQWACLVKDVPRKFGLFVRNNCGAPLSTSSSISAWAASTAYTIGTLVIPTTSTGHYYLCILTGSSESAEPTWPTTGKTVIDGGATWLDIGTDAPNTLSFHGENDQLS
jgi:hypothetical protein